MAVSPASVPTVSLEPSFVISTPPASAVPEMVFSEAPGVATDSTPLEFAVRDLRVAVSLNEPIPFSLTAATSSDESGR